jgi:hypothetical protein
MVTKFSCVTSNSGFIQTCLLRLSTYLKFSLEKQGTNFKLVGIGVPTFLVRRPTWRGKKCEAIFIDLRPSRKTEPKKIIETCERLTCMAVIDTCLGILMLKLGFRGRTGSGEL